MSGDFGMWEEEGSSSAFANVTEEYNFTLTCAARAIQGPIELPYSSALTTTVRVIQAIYYSIIILAGLFLNTLVIVLVVKYKKLHSLSYLVSLQVVVLNLLFSVTLIANLVSAIANQWLLGEYACAITGLLYNIAALTRTLLMCVFVIDRYFAVVWPYFYPKHKFKITVSISIAAWVFSAVVAIAMLPGLLDCYIFSVAAKTCLNSSVCGPTCFIYTRSYSVVLVPATILPIVLYGLLYYKARKIQQELATAHANYRKEWKATITYSLLFFTLLVLILPSSAISIVATVSRSGDFSAASYAIIAINSGILALLVVTDPIVIMRDKDVKEVLYEIKNSAFRRPTELRNEHANTAKTVKVATTQL